MVLCVYPLYPSPDGGLRSSDIGLVSLEAPGVALDGDSRKHLPLLYVDIPNSDTSELMVSTVFF